MSGEVESFSIALPVLPSENSLANFTEAIRTVAT
jgi:hypothetical protein